MPIPKPKEGETREKYLQRCMGDGVMNKEYKDSKQRYAVCNTEWKRKGKKSSEESDDK